MAEQHRGIYGRHGEKLRFFVVGGWNTLFSIAVLWMFDRLIPYDQNSLLQKEAVLVTTWIVSVTQNFFTFKLLVFRTRGNWLHEYGKMYMTYAAAFVLQSVLALAISQLFDLSVFWASLPTIVVVMIASYFGHKYFTFRRPVREHG
ncbi:MAG: GtrA family protein [Actinomycetota bacterium]|nr:GtrA family protein [Actinomycetota bacterium]